MLDLEPKCIQLHGLCDASQQAYGACIYLRIKYSNGRINTNLICSKSRVAPLKVISLPRLELCGAVLLSRLVNKISKILTTIAINSIHLWTDSKIVLSWINSPSNKWNTFVSHRVSEIQELTLNAEWRHVSSAENSADIITRGVGPLEIFALSSWWHGPHWLSLEQTEWPVNEEKLQNLPEQRKVATCAHVENKWNLKFNRFSNFNKLIRTFAYCFRFIETLKAKKKLSNYLTCRELEKAHNFVINLIQLD